LDGLTGPVAIAEVELIFGPHRLHDAQLDCRLSGINENLIDLLFSLGALSLAPFKLACECEWLRGDCG
jgi:hypothetical protein